MDEILAKLERIQQLWKEQEKVKPGTREHEALMKQIPALALEYHVIKHVGEGQPAQFLHDALSF
jgi:hypothetical protein